MTTSACFRFTVCLSLLVLSLAHPTPVSACSCAARGLPAQEFREANAVFTGRVLRIVDEYVPVFSTLDRILTIIGKQPYFWAQAGHYVGYRIYFDINSSWKGVTTASAVVDTGYGLGDCGYAFTVNADYLVYAAYPYGAPSPYWVTSICTRNAELSAATEDLKYLTTLPTLSLQRSFQIFGLPVEIAIVLAGILLTASLVFWYARNLQIRQAKD